MNLKGSINIDPRDSPEPLLLAGPQPTQQGGAGEEEEPALLLPGVGVVPHHQGVPQLVDAESEEHKRLTKPFGLRIDTLGPR